MSVEGMMFVGDKGKILSGFRLENPRIIPERKMRKYGRQTPSHSRDRRRRDGPPGGVAKWIAACRDGHNAVPGNFLEAGPISEAFNLAAVALRVGARIEYDAATMKITNRSEANRYLTREYRRGWEL
jgi:hypothetical protein